MIHLVFVHGVANRKTPNPKSYQDNLDRRRKYFRDFCFDGNEVAFYDPYWGDVASKPAMSFASIPGDDTQSLSIGLPDHQLVNDDVKDSKVLLNALRRDFAGVINSLSLEISSRENADLGIADGLARYVISRGVVDGEIALPSWINSRDDMKDVDVLDRLEREAQALVDDASLGIGNVVRAAGMRLLNEGIDVASHVLEPFARKFTPQLATFLGDAFVYLREGRARREIRNCVLAGLREACEAKKAGDKLVVVAHSMGANIVYDMLTDPNYQADLKSLGVPLEIDLFLSVGTQLGLFQEFGLFQDYANGKLGAKPSSCINWWHIFNRMDVLSFGVENVFDGVEQFSVNTFANIKDAHSAYFDSIYLMRRLKLRLQEAGLVA